MATCFQIGECFRPRPVRFEGVRELAGYRMKVYSILYGTVPVEWDRFEEAMQLAEATLPRPAVTIDRPGVGFIIAHQGRGMQYFVLCWWARENELPQRIWVREYPSGDRWREASECESICVWDMEIIGFERQVYVESVLASVNQPDIDGYLAQQMHVTG